MCVSGSLFSIAVTVIVAVAVAFATNTGPLMPYELLSESYGHLHLKESVKDFFLPLSSLFVFYLFSCTYKYDILVLVACVY